uniref:Uncharacterized protein n=1 Tax=Panstrongylus lignarius TaxID=156445 RepID=A0A224Y4H7_9HEMI
MRTLSISSITIALQCSLSIRAKHSAKKNEAKLDTITSALCSKDDTNFRRSEKFCFNTPPNAEIVSVISDCLK